MTDAEARPPSRHSPAKRHCRRSRLPKTPGTPAIPRRSAWRIRPDSQWRNCHEHVVGRVGIVAFLTRKWQRELDYSLRKSLWDFHDNRIAVRFQYECHDADGQWYRSYGNELWEFAPNGLMARREASINDVPIEESERRYFGPRPASEHGQEIPLLVTAARVFNSTWSARLLSEESKSRCTRHDRCADKACHDRRGRRVRDR